MLGFIKKYFFTAIVFINFNLSGCFLMNNQEWKIRNEII